MSKKGKIEVLKKKSKLFQEPVFRTEVLVKLKDLKDSDAAAFITTEIEKGVKRYILTFSRIYLSDLDHECIHLVASVFIDRGISLDLNNHPNQEVFGYYHCYWVDRIWKVIKNWRKP